MNNEQEWFARFDEIRAKFRTATQWTIAAIQAEYDRMMAWADRVSKGEVGPEVEDSAAADGVTGPEVITATTRGYSERGLSGNSFPTPTAGPFSDD